MASPTSDNPTLDLQYLIQENIELESEKLANQAEIKHLKGTLKAKEAEDNRKMMAAMEYIAAQNNVFKEELEGSFKEQVHEHSTSLVKLLSRCQLRT